MRKILKSISYSLDFIDDQEIQLHHLGVVSSVNAWDPITEEAVLQALDLILNPSNYPMMIMCNLGRHRTGNKKYIYHDLFFSCYSKVYIKSLGTIVGCMRKLQRWNLTSIFEEYRRYAGPKVRLLNEQFIELFDTDLVGIPTNKPKWM